MSPCGALRKMSTPAAGLTWVKSAASRENARFRADGVGAQKADPGMVAAAPALPPKRGQRRKVCRSTPDLLRDASGSFAQEVA